uniref:Uncharacterized protein n=1 Tax=Kalanchoe fedtschenkoi TaxID=63787 RepID=A0A7N1A3X3_KALFE
MQVAARSRGLATVFRTHCFLISTRLPAVEPPASDAVHNLRHYTNCPRQKLSDSVGNGRCIHGQSPREKCSLCCMMAVRLYSTEASGLEASPTDAAKGVYDKMSESIKARTCPPNALMWSLIENCKKKEDIKLLFTILPELRIFRLSNLHIPSNFNNNLCLEITKACIRVGAIDYAKKGLIKHNIYGLSPSIPSAHQILLHAKEQNDTKLMVDIMKLIKRNDLPLQPGTADIVFSICHIADDWNLLSKYMKRFLRAGVKFRQTTFDSWMEFAAKRGDTKSLWEAEKLRSESKRKHTLASGFACAKGLLLEHKPDDSANAIQHLNQELTGDKRAGVIIELQKLVSEWPQEVLKYQKEEDRKALAAVLKSDIPKMVSRLGMDVSVNLENLDKEEGMRS